MTAAAQQVKDPAKSFRKSTLGTEDDWQEQAWKYLELVGELAYYVSWRSASASRVRLVASVLGEDGQPTGDLPDEDDAEAARVREIVNAIAGGAAGQSALLKRGVYLLTIPGEYWAAMVVRDPAREQSEGSLVVPTPETVRRTTPLREEWFTFSRDEITTRGDQVFLSLPDGTKHEFDPQVDLMFRVWEPHPKKASQPFSPVWSNRAVLNEIVKSTATIDNAAKSRLVGNGLMFIPQEMSLPSQNSPMAQPVGSPPVSGNTDPAWEPSTSQELQDLIYEVASTAIKDPDSLAALIPIIAAAPGEWIKNIQWLRPSSDVPETALKTRTEAIRRLAMGLDVAPERLLGIGENSNHWAAWAIGDDDVRIHIAPPVETICHAYTQEVLRPKLIEEGIDPDKYVLWHDDTRLTQDPDKKAEAKEAFDRGALSASALLTYMGFDEADGYDLDTRDGWVALARDKAASDPTLIPLLAPLLGPALEGVSAPALPAPSKPAEDEDTPAPESEPEQPTVTEPDTDGDGLNASAYGLTRMCVNRALEMANKRRRTRSNRDLFDGALITEAHLRLPPVPKDDVAALIRGWDTCVDAKTCAAFGFTAREFRTMIEDTAGQSLTTGTPWTFDRVRMTAARERQ